MMNFSELIKANQNNVKNIIRLITKQDNEDLEQEVYIKAWKNANKYEERGNFKSWISTIAKNVSKDYLKSSYFKNNQVIDYYQFFLDLYNYLDSQNFSFLKYQIIDLFISLNNLADLNTSSVMITSFNLKNSESLNFTLFKF